MIYNIKSIYVITIMMIIIALLLTYNLFIMKKSLKLISLLFISIAITSCNKEDNITPSENIESEFFTSNYIYKGVEYVVDCELVNDSIIFLNQEFNNLYENEISKHTNLCTYLRADGKIEYFTEEIEMKAVYNLPIIDKDKLEQTIETKGSIQLGYNTMAHGSLTLYDDVNFKDRFLSLSLSYGTDYIAKAHLKPDYDFNDKTSSIKIESSFSSGARFEAWENDNYSGRSIFIESHSIIEIPNENNIYYKDKTNLKRIPCGSGNWNDRITSFIYYYKNSPPPVYPR